MLEGSFVMTYPCFFLLTKEGNPELVDIDDAHCVCLFTDRHLVEEFHRHKYGTGGWHSLETFSIKDHGELLHVLQDWEPEFAKEGVTFIAIDVSPGKAPMYTTFPALIAEVAKG